MTPLLTFVQLSKKNAEIKRLKSNIKSVVNLAEDRNRRVKVDAHNQQMQDKQAHDTKANKLREEIATLKKKLQDNTAEHREKEQSLRKVEVRICNLPPKWLGELHPHRGGLLDQALVPPLLSL